MNMDSSLAVIFLFIVALAALSTGRKMFHTYQREKSRREIAAYIAEGAMTPEQGERLMQSGERPTPDND
jgi:hypothetical protein